MSTSSSTADGDLLKRQWSLR